MNWNTEFKGRWQLQTWLVDVQVILLNFHRVLMIDGLKFSIYHVAQEFHVTKSFQSSESASDPPGIIRVHWVWFPWFFLSCHIFFLCSSSVSVNDAGPQLVIFWGPLWPKGPGQKRREWNLVTGTCRQIRETLVLRGSNCLVLLAKIHLDLPTGSIVACLIPKPWVLSTSTFLEWLSSNSPFSKNLMCKLDENIYVNHTRIMYLSASHFSHQFLTWLDEAHKPLVFGHLVLPSLRLVCCSFELPRHLLHEIKRTWERWSYKLWISWEETLAYQLASRCLVIGKTSQGWTFWDTWTV